MDIKPEKARLFMAIEIPEHIIKKLKKIQGYLKSMGLKMKWVRPENIHLTIKFFGDVELEKIEDIHGAMISVCERYNVFSLFINGIGVFPSLKRPRVLWTGISGDIDTLKKLNHDMETELLKKGFPNEDRKFKGHLTIARIKGGRVSPEKLITAIRAFSDFESVPFKVDSINLIRSRLKQTGAEYENIRQVHL